MELAVVAGAEGLFSDLWSWLDFKANYFLILNDHASGNPFSRTHRITAKSKNVAFFYISIFHPHIMPHITRVAKWESLSNGQVAYTLRVDNDPTSDFPMALTVADASDHTILQTKLTAGKVQAEALYDASLASEAEAMTKVGQPI